MSNVRSLLSVNRLVADLIPLLQERVVVRYFVEHSFAFGIPPSKGEFGPALVNSAHLLAIRKQRLVGFSVELTIAPEGVDVAESQVIFEKDIPEKVASLLKHWKEIEDRKEWCVPQQFVGVVKFGTGARTEFPPTHDYFKALHGFAASAIPSKMHEMYEKCPLSIFEPDIFAGAICDRFSAFLGETLYKRWSEDFVPI